MPKCSLEHSHIMKEHIMDKEKMNPEAEEANLIHSELEIEEVTECLIASLQADQ